MSASELRGPEVDTERPEMSGENTFTQVTFMRPEILDHDVFSGLFPDFFRTFPDISGFSVCCVWGHMFECLCSTAVRADVFVHLAWSHAKHFVFCLGCDLTDSMVLTLQRMASVQCTRNEWCGDASVDGKVETFLQSWNIALLNHSVGVSALMVLQLLLHAPSATGVVCGWLEYTLIKRFFSECGVESTRVSDLRACPFARHHGCLMHACTCTHLLVSFQDLPLSALDGHC